MENRINPYTQKEATEKWLFLWVKLWESRLSHSPAGENSTD